MAEKETLYISPTKLLLAIALVVIVGFVAFSQMLRGNSGPQISSGYSGPAVAVRAAEGMWSADACQRYLRQVFDFPKLSLVHGTAWYYDCEHTPVMKYPTAPAPLPPGKYMPTLPY